MENASTIYIKNMVCSRCKMIVEAAFGKLGIEVLSVELGEVRIKNPLTKEQLTQLNNRLAAYGFELIGSRKARIIEQIKNCIIRIVHTTGETPDINLSQHLSGKLHLEYHYLSNLFSAVEGITIEQYFIAQKIERVKELLMYDELTLSEISYQLGYSSVAHLSAQFKKQTGVTPTAFKSERTVKRKNIEDL